MTEGIFLVVVALLFVVAFYAIVASRRSKEDQIERLLKSTAELSSWKTVVERSQHEVGHLLACFPDFSQELGRPCLKCNGDFGTLHLYAKDYYPHASLRAVGDLQERFAGVCAVDVLNLLLLDPEKLAPQRIDESALIKAVELHSNNAGLNPQVTALCSATSNLFKDFRAQYRNIECPIYRLRLCENRLCVWGADGKVGLQDFLPFMLAVRDLCEITNRLLKE